MSPAPQPPPGPRGAGDASAAHRLPYTFEPERYDLHLAPDLDAATFTGEVRITGVLHEPVSQLVLHAAELAVESAEIVAGGPPRHAAAVVDEAAERLVLEPGALLPAGPCSVQVRFSGVLNDKLRGFYRSTFTDAAGVTRTIATTQFEATDARRAFPCLDEPDRKAVFSVTLDVPEGMAAYANGPEIGADPLPGGGRRVRFADTIPMSSYLVAFVVGPLEATAPRVVDGTPVRVVHAPGKEALTGFALEVAAHALRFFAEFFGIPYPAQKLDLVAIPDFAFGAMENLGCVTFRETALLVDPARASRLELERVADVVCHEIAHMWFGDLVTMKWWNGIWLNEAFATLMELLCVDAFRPEWQRWVSFGAERDVAMATDALHRTRPVEYPVGPPEEAQGMFDVLTYQKGAGVLRMLERYLGPQRFRDGIRRYLAEHALGNTDTEDLWDALEAASGEPVRAVMATWIGQGGFPLVLVRPSGGGPGGERTTGGDAGAGADRDDGAGAGDGAGNGTGGSGTVVVDQEPFHYAPATGPSAIGSGWQVPVIARSLDHGHEVRVLLGPEPATVAAGAGPVVVNAGGWGFYRVHYPPQALHALADRIADLEPLERCNLLSDAWAAVLAARTDLGDFLALCEAMARSGEVDPDVWAQATGALGFLDHALDGEARDALARYTRRLAGPAFARLGWEPAPGESERTGTVRAQLLSVLGTVGADPDIHRECARRQADDDAGVTPVAPDLAAAVATVAATVGGPAEFDRFLERSRRAATPQEEIRFLYALAAFADEQLAARTFELALTEVRTQNAPFLVQLLLTNRTTGPATWGRLSAAWDRLLARIPATTVPRMLEGVKVLCRDSALASEIASFLTTHPVPTGQRTVDQIVERLGVNVTVAQRLRNTAASALSAGIERLSVG